VSVLCGAYFCDKARDIEREKSLTEAPSLRQGYGGQAEGEKSVLRIFEYKNSQHNCSSPNSAFQARIRR